VLGTLLTGHIGQRSVRVDNYSKSDWPGIEVLNLPSWLSVSKITPNKRAVGTAVPRQSWTVDLRADPRGMPSGVIRQPAKICQASGQISSDLPVIVSFEAPVTLAPSTLMFGAVRRNGPAQSKVLVMRFHEKAMVGDPWSIVAGSNISGTETGGRKRGRD
jgi:hypothetical protein